jgi:hypothetical protein
MHTVRASVLGYLGTSQGLTEGAERFFDLAVQRKDIVLKGNLRPVMEAFVWAQGKWL